MLERRCSNLCKCCEDLQEYKQRVREVFDGLLIGFQEEATSKWSSETERKVWSMAYRDVVSKLKEIGLEDE